MVCSLRVVMVIPSFFQLRATAMVHRSVTWVQRAVTGRVCFTQTSTQAKRIAYPLARMAWASSKATVVTVPTMAATTALRFAPCATKNSKSIPQLTDLIITNSNPQCR